MNPIYKYPLILHLYFFYACLELLIKETSKGLLNTFTLRRKFLVWESFFLDFQDLLAMENIVISDECS